MTIAGLGWDDGWQAAWAELGLEHCVPGRVVADYGAGCRVATPEEMSAEEYVKRVINGELKDPTLSFQLKEGFSVMAVVPDYLPHDKESLGYAAIIEWINPLVAKPEDYTGSLSLTFNKPASPQ